MLEPTTTPSVKTLICSTSCLFFIPKPAIIGSFVDDLIVLIDFCKCSISADFCPVIPEHPSYLSWHDEHNAS